jgi:ammonium transporter Rh
LNATLAGGVCIGASADLLFDPYAAILIGAIAGIISSYGFAVLGG